MLLMTRPLSGRLCHSHWHCRQKTVEPKSPNRTREVKSKCSKNHIGILALLLLTSLLFLWIAIVTGCKGPSTYRIAYRSEVNGNQEISVMDADGMHQTRLTNTAELDLLPAWSP